MCEQHLGAFAQHKRNDKLVMEGGRGETGFARMDMVFIRLFLRIGRFRRYDYFRLCVTYDKLSIFWGKPYIIGYTTLSICDQK